MKATEQYFPVVLFIVLYKVILTFESVDEIQKCDHWNESYWAVFSSIYDASPRLMVYLTRQYSLKRQTKLKQLKQFFSTMLCDALMTEKASKQNYRGVKCLTSFGRVPPRWSFLVGGHNTALNTTEALVWCSGIQMVLMSHFLKLMPYFNIMNSFGTANIS